MPYISASDLNSATDIRVLPHRVKTDSWRVSVVTVDLPPTLEKDWNYSIGMIQRVYIDGLPKIEPSDLKPFDDRKHSH